MKNLWKNSQQLRNSASRFTSKSIILGSTLAVSVTAVLMSNTLSNSEGTLACACSSNVTYDTMLPASHPQNRCASQTKELNWGTWLTGKSGSSQFHFFDLFELLHGKRSGNFDKPNANDINPE